MFQQESFIGFMCHDIKGHAKFKGKLTCCLKNDIRDLIKFHGSSRKSENLHFDRLLLSKAYIVLVEKVKQSYVSWHWRAMQSLKKNGLLVPRLTWWILMRVVAILKIFFLICYVCDTTPKNDTIFEEELSWTLKNDMKNLANFDSTLKSLKSFG